MPSSISRVPEKITLVGFTRIQFFDYGAYLGYSTDSWDYRIRSFISHRKHGSYIFNINKTIILLKNALSFFLRIAIKRGYCALVNENLLFKERFDLYFDKMVNIFRRLAIVSEKLERGILTSRKLTHSRKRVFGKFPHTCFVSSPSISDYFIDETAVINIPAAAICDTTLFSLKTVYMIPASEKSFKFMRMLNALFYMYFLKGNMLRMNVFRDDLYRGYKKKLKDSIYRRVDSRFIKIKPPKKKSKLFKLLKSKSL